MDPPPSALDTPGVANSSSSVSAEVNELPRRPNLKQGDDPRAKALVPGSLGAVCLEFLQKVIQTFGEHSTEVTEMFHALFQFKAGRMSKREAHYNLSQHLRDHEELLQGLDGILAHEDARWGPGDFIQREVPQHVPGPDMNPPGYLQPHHEPQLRLPSMAHVFHHGQMPFVQDSPYSNASANCASHEGPENQLHHQPAFFQPTNSYMAWDPQPSVGLPSPNSFVPSNAPAVLQQASSPSELQSTLLQYSDIYMEVEFLNANLSSNLTPRQSALVFDMQSNLQPYNQVGMGYSIPNTDSVSGYGVEQKDRQPAYNEGWQENSNIFEEDDDKATRPEDSANRSNKKWVQSQDAARPTEFVHGLCGKTFTTRSAVKKHHWGPKSGDVATTRGCWAAYGKPDRPWDEHPSCRYDTLKPIRPGKSRAKKDTQAKPLAKAPMVPSMVHNPNNLIPGFPTLQELPRTVAETVQPVMMFTSPQAQTPMPERLHRENIDTLLTAASVAERLEAPTPQDGRNDSVVSRLDDQASRVYGSLHTNMSSHIKSDPSMGPEAPLDEAEGEYSMLHSDPAPRQGYYLHAPPRMMLESQPQRGQL